ncbi:hypothetical protein [Plastoroseomonas hellenica]|uniref:hypothetical protein n=1 Tax=Plastoroseomonas hellenica TaxID=2687306 RepID=UPI001BA6E38F|nr:hypothetical protein [Plastoroseomonas hellenica]MBR0646517.1 hypothetical protein [Plastoroseomonas hellenica]
MLTPPFEEWLAALAPSERQRALELLDKFNALAARDTELWVRSEISEGIPQFARYLVLRSLWPDHIDPWARNAGTWIGQAIKAADSQPDGDFAEAGRALGRAISAGVSMADLGAIARMIAFETAFGVLNHIDEGHDPAAGADAPGWRLVETDADGATTGRPVVGLHEDVLSTAPPRRDDEGQA